MFYVERNAVRKSLFDCMCKDSKKMDYSCVFMYKCAINTDNQALCLRFFVYSHLKTNIITDAVSVVV